MNNFKLQNKKLRKENDLLKEGFSIFVHSLYYEKITLEDDYGYMISIPMQHINQEELNTLRACQKLVLRGEK